MRLYLEYRDGSVQLPRGDTIIGRDVGCSLRFNDPFVSRRHVRIHFGNDGIFVEELASRNGTLLNGEQIRGRQDLKNGDTLKLGKRSLSISIVGDETIEGAVETTRPEGVLAGMMEIDAAMRELTDAPATLPAPPPERTCPTCRKSVAASAEFCSSCGHAFPYGRPASLTQKIDLDEVERELAEERRTEARRSLEVPVVYTSETLTIDAVTYDLSRGGVFIASPLLDEVGTRCHVTLLPEAAPAIPIESEVARVVEEGEFGMGIRFRSPSERARRWLDTVLERT